MRSSHASLRSGHKRLDEQPAEGLRVARMAVAEQRVPRNVVRCESTEQPIPDAEQRAQVVLRGCRHMMEMMEARRDEHGLEEAQVQ